MKQSVPTMKMLLALFIFGTIAPFVRAIPLPSPVISMLRGLVGAAVLLAVLLLRGKKLDCRAIVANKWYLLASGAMIGLNWVLLFEAYKYTSVATVTLCYYLSPTFVTLAAPLVLREKGTPVGYLCAGVSLLGMVLLNGAGGGGTQNGLGILLGVGAAVLYASGVLMNKKMHPMPSSDRTILQLGTAGLVMIPYAALTGGFENLSLNFTGAAALAAICLVHTALAYSLYLGSIAQVSAAKTAIFAYLDPVVAVLISVTLLGEPMTVQAAIGAVLILGAAIFGGVYDARKKETV